MTYYWKSYFDEETVLPPTMWTTTASSSSSQASMVPTTRGIGTPPSQAHERLCLSVLLTSPSRWEKSILATNLNTSCTMHSTLTKTCGSVTTPTTITCFRCSSTLRGHVNAWTGSPDNRCDGGVAAARELSFSVPCSMCLAEHLKGGAAMRQLVQGTRRWAVEASKTLLISPRKAAE